MTNPTAIELNTFCKFIYKLLLVMEIEYDQTIRSIITDMTTELAYHYGRDRKMNLFNDSMFFAKKLMVLFNKEWTFPISNLVGEILLDLLADADQQKMTMDYLIMNE